MSAGSMESVKAKMKERKEGDVLKIEISRDIFILLCEYQGKHSTGTGLGLSGV